MVVQYVTNKWLSPMLVTQSQKEYLDSLSSSSFGVGQLVYLVCCHIDGTDDLGNRICRLITSFLAQTDIGFC